MPEYERFLHKTDRCPLCQSTKATFHSFPQTNRYSEAIAAHINAEEGELLKILENLTCNSCGLIYKKSWFNPDVLSALFNELIPLHPRGWDTISGRFSPKTFYHELTLYAEALKKGDTENINRYRRALPSILDSIQEKDLLFNREEALQHIEAGKLEYFSAQSEKIKASFGKPEPFERFSGYVSQSLWEHATRLVQPVHSYAEIGCPLWGMLRISTDLGLKTIYTKKKEVNFWTDKCRDDGITCVQKCTSIWPAVEIMSWDDLKSHKVDLMGVYQYTDHLEQPMEFFQQLFERARGIIATVDNSHSSATYIQHFTGWTNQAAICVADTFGKKLDYSFTEAKKAKLHTFIFH
jgi:hypothetical protein